MGHANTQSPAGPRSDPPQGVFHVTGAVDVAVIVVTYNNAEDIAPLVSSLRLEAVDQRLRVIVVDNDSRDETATRVQEHEDIVLLKTGGNLGYAGGINRAITVTGEAQSLFVLNPDLRVRPGCIPTLRHAMLTTGAGIVVPAIESAGGDLTLSLRREPRVLNRLGDAVFGSRWANRPGLLSETVREASHYGRAHPIEWATGAALLISGDAARHIGLWDERFFLYSEETDYFKRAREAGYACWFDPCARVIHLEGGSGRSEQLVALTVVNAVRYTQKHHSWASPLHRTILAAHELRRWRDPDHRIARTILLLPSRWPLLPQASRNREDTVVDHVLVTRFNLPSKGSEQLIRAQDGWLQERIQLFERYTVPSVLAQTSQNFSWIVYLDPESPPWLLERLQPLVGSGVFTPFYRESVGWQDLAADARSMTGAQGDILITTNLDNDDALASDFVERLQAAALPGRREALFITNGLIRTDREIYLRRDPVNAFCSVAEPWDQPQTAWRDWHILLGRHMPSRQLDGPPGWLQVVHARNVSNRVRGRLISPEGYTQDFADLLDDLPSLPRRRLVLDRFARAPLREAKEAIRAGVKAVLLRLFGKQGLDRLREHLKQSLRRRAQASASPTSEQTGK